MSLKLGIILVYIGVALILQSSVCDAGSRGSSSNESAQVLAKKTGAAHFEEHYEPIESSEERDEHRVRKRASDEDFDYEVYQGVVGRPGIDFPIHAHIPQTSFSCRQYGNGYFADLETDCQVFHICDDGRKISFLCPNGTIFQQPELICDWWFKVNCGKSPGFYADSAEILSRSQNRRKSHHKQQQHQRIESEYESGKRNSYRTNTKSNGNKSQYPLKSSSRRYEESDRLNSAKPDRRIDSDENVSVETVDFEDITEGSRTYYKKSDKLQSASRPSEEEAENESQVLAETASFVGNNPRNGYNYENPQPIRKESDERESYERQHSNQKPRSDRGRQKFDFRSNVYKHYSDPRPSPDFVEPSTTQPTQAPFQTTTKPSLIHRADKRVTTPRAATYTTARRFDVTKTTPYYTPTVPTVANRFGEYKSTPANPTATYAPVLLSTPNPFADRKAASQFQQRNGRPSQAIGDYQYSKPASFRAASTTPVPNRTTYYVPDGRRPAVDIRSNPSAPPSPGFYSSTPGSFSTTPGPFSTTPSGFFSSTPRTFSTTPGQFSSSSRGYDYSFSNPTRASVDFGTSKLSSPAPFSVYGSGEKSSEPVDVIINRRVEPKNIAGVTTTVSPQTNTGSSVEVLSSDEPTNFDLDVKFGTNSPVETVTGNGVLSGGQNSGKLISTPGYSYTNPSTLNSIDYSTTRNFPTSATAPTRSGFRNLNIDPTNEASQDLSSAKRNIFGKSGNALLQSRFDATTTIRPKSGGSSDGGSTVSSDDIPPTTYRPSITTTAQPSVVEHVKEMIKTLNDLKLNLKVPQSSREGLEIPASSGPETLLSLAEYFASEESTSTTVRPAQSDDTASEDAGDDVEVKPDLSTSNLTGKTVNKYENLFGLASTTEKPEPTLSPDYKPNIAPDTGNDLEGQHSSGFLGNTVGKPETRKIAQVFTNALSAYLQDPESFRRVLNEVRPTEPPGAADAEFNEGTAASYLPTGVTGGVPTTTVRTAGEGLEVLDYSDVTITPGSETATQRSAKIVETTASPAATTTEEPGYLNTATATAIPSYVDRVPASKLITESQKKVTSNGDVQNGSHSETEANAVAEEVNAGLGLSTVEPYLSLAESVAARKPTRPDGSSAEWPTTTASPASIAYELLPPSAVDHADDDEDTLQRAQSQSFVTARNNLNRFESKRFEKLKLSTTPAAPHEDDFSQSGHYITRLMGDSRVTTEVPSYNKGTVTPYPTTAYTSFVDPLTINDGLMKDARTTTTASPNTYLPRSTPSQATPIDVEVEDFGQTGTSTVRIDLLHPDLLDEVLPPRNGIQRMANKMFGNLDAESANHLMSVMKKAESNSTVRKLILLLIQTCDEDYSRTVEQSRKILLNALIGMDQKLEGDEEVRVFKLDPRRESRNFDRSEKLIASSSESPVTYPTTRGSISTQTTTDYGYSTTTGAPGSAEETSNPDDDLDAVSSSTTVKPFDYEYSTVASTPEATAYSTTDAPWTAGTTRQPVAFGSRTSSRRRTKDVNDSLGQPGQLSHKNSDERALELLKSLYSLASKFSKR